jgi:energy-coupling factor transporter ATP-binding protein EcfA2
MFPTYSGFLEEAIKQRNRLFNLIDKLLVVKECTSIFQKIGQIGEMMNLYYTFFMKQENHQTIRYTFFIHDFNKDILSLQNHVKDRTLSACKYKKRTSMKGVYYLAHLQDNKIRNDIDLKENIILSGPNASGKTTLLKSLFLNSIMSQQFGYGCYTSATILCYDSFHSYLNIPDTSGRDSLFQAEARRCKEILDQIMNGDKRHLCIFDEIYSGTNPRDAVTCATLYLRELNRYKSRVDYLITTHYVEICESFQKGDTKNPDSVSCVSVKKMTVREMSDHLEYDYKMVEGISYIHGGLHILRQLNYPASLYESV